MRVGFIGLGRMGKPMALNLLRAGFPLTVHNRSRGKVEELVQQGATPATSPAEVAARCEVVLTCLPDVPTVEQVYLGPEGILEGARPGHLLADHSTVDLATSRRLAQAAAGKGATFLDAPISGGVERAADGTLTIMVGGPPEAFERARPVFAAMGRHLYHLGPSGSGTAMKLLNQLLVAVHTVAAAEALVLAAKAGIDVARALEVLLVSWGASFMLQRNGPAILERRFGGERGPIRLLYKDIALVCQMAQEVGAPIPLGETARTLFEEGAARGLLEQDIAALVLPLEERAGVRVGQAG